MMTTLHTVDTAPALGHPATAWLSALRDGYYDQGHSYLKQGPAIPGGGVMYCCLGVACELSGLGRWELVGGRTPESDVDDAVYTYAIKAPSSVAASVPIEPLAGCLPDEVRRRLGLRTHLGEFWVTQDWLDRMYEVDPDVADRVATHLVCAGGAAAVDSLELGEPIAVTLAGLNDDAGLDFDALAAVVESVPPGLFETL